MNSFEFRTFIRRFKYLFQKYILRRKPGRQRFFIIKIEPEMVDTVYDELLKRGFQPNYFSYYDSGEVCNVRRLAKNRQLFLEHKEGFQEHVRVFPNEIRGHYEIKYEEDAKRHLDGSTVTSLSRGTNQEIKQIVTALRQR